MVGCPLAAAAAVLSCKVQPGRWIAPHLAVRTLFDHCRWECWVTQPVQRTPLWPASWLPVVDKSRGSKSVEVQRVWEVYNERLQFVSWRDAVLLKGLASIWAPASEDSSHVGNAGVGVVGMRGAPPALPSFATAQYKSFFDCGRAVRCLLPLAAGRFMHLFVLYDYQGADADAEQLALTEQLFDAALGELHVVARGQPCLLVCDFNVEPTKIPCLAKGMSVGLWVDFEEAWALAAGLQPTPTCKRDWTAAGGRRRDFVIGCPLAAAAILSCKVQPDRWIAPHLAIRALFDYCRWESWVTQPVQRTPFGLLLGCLLLTKVIVPSRLRFREFGRFMMSIFSLCLVRMPLCLMSLLVWDDVSMAWLSGLGLLSLRLLMHLGSVVVLFLLGF